METHPLEIFVPTKAKYLLLGSFMARAYGADSYDWYYGSKRNQFWPMLEQVYGVELKTKDSKQDLFSKLGLALGDIIYQCERKMGNSLDANLVNIVYNIGPIEQVLRENNIERIYFSSKFVEKNFRKIFKDVKIELITLPSPSPRYAAMARQQKLARYKSLLPSLPDALANTIKKTIPPTASK